MSSETDAITFGARPIELSRIWRCSQGIPRQEVAVG